MNLRLIWHPAAEVALLARRHWRIAAEIDAAVIRLAETGQGDLVAVPPLHHLRAAGHVVTLQIEYEAEILWVLDVSRVR